MSDVKTCDYVDENHCINLLATKVYPFVVASAHARRHVPTSLQTGSRRFVATLHRIRNTCCDNGYGRTLLLYVYSIS